MFIGINKFLGKIVYRDKHVGFLYRLLTFPEIADTALFEKFITFEAGIMDEKELIRRLKDGGDGSEAGFRELYELYSPTLYRFVYSYVKSADTAREITHEALVGLCYIAIISTRDVPSEAISSHRAKTP